MNTTTTLFLRSDPAMYTSPGRTYARVGVRDPARMYVRGRVYFLAPWLYVRVHAMCSPLLRHVPFLTRPRCIPAACRQTDRMYVHVRYQNDNTTYASTRWVPTVRHFLVCEDVAGGSQQSGGRIILFFCPNALPCVRRCSWWVPTVRGRIVFFAWTHFLTCEDVAGGSQRSGGNVFFMKYGGPSGGSQQSGGNDFFRKILVARLVGPRCQ